MEIIKQEIKLLNTYITNCILQDKNHISDELNDYLSTKSKRIRPIMIILFSKAFNIELNEKILSLAASVELIHNATLIHDDILDNASIRRCKISLNYKLGNNLSILAGDLLLSIALKQLAKSGNINVVDIFSNSLSFMCKGEIEQNYTIEKLPKMEEYINKSRNKTAELFIAALTSLCLIANIEKKENLKRFAKNFGIAFQIKDDLLNIINTDNSKPALSDIYNGIFTAPVILLNKDKKNIQNLTKQEIIKQIQSDKKYIQQTIDIIKKYANEAIVSIDFIEDNQYKKEIIKIAQNLYKANI